MQKLTLDRLKTVLSYDPLSGLFVWKQRLSRRIHIGDVAGKETFYGYVSIKIDGVDFHAHRLAWFYVQGVWHPEDVDHRNGVRTDNRFSNLRQATRTQNQHNRKAKGYCWHKRSSKWVASVRVGYRQIHLGSFDTESEARQAYLVGCVTHHGAEWSENK